MKYECKLVATGNKVYQSNEMGKHNGTRRLTVQLPDFYPTVGREGQSSHAENSVDTSFWFKPWWATSPVASLHGAMRVFKFHFCFHTIYLNTVFYDFPRGFKFSRIIVWQQSDVCSSISYGHPLNEPEMITQKFMYPCET